MQPQSAPPFEMKDVEGAPARWAEFEVFRARHQRDEPEPLFAWTCPFETLGKQSYEDTTTSFAWPLITNTQITMQAIQPALNSSSANHTADGDARRFIGPGTISLSPVPRKMRATSGR